MDFVVRTRKPDEMRYCTIGDWYEGFEHGRPVIYIDVVEGPDEFTFPIQVHEMYEALACIRDHVDEADVSAFDKAHPDDDDPGELADAPYLKQHIAATALERGITSMLGADWREYLAYCNEAWMNVKKALAAKEIFTEWPDPLIRKMPALGYEAFYKIMGAVPLNSDSTPEGAAEPTRDTAPSISEGEHE